MYRIKSLVLGAGWILGAVILLALPAAAQTLEWEVVNRFPLFTNDVHFARIAGIRTPENPLGTRLWAASGSAADTINTEGFTQRLRQMLPTTVDTAWRPKEALYDRELLMRTGNRIVGRSSLQTHGCTWRLADAQTASVVEQSDADCALSKPIPVDITKAYTLQLLNPAGVQHGDLTSIKIDVRLVVALGDSFASGEGNPDHPAVFRRPKTQKEPPFVSERWMTMNPVPADLLEKDARWWDPVCHRSLLSWPSMAALRRAVQSPHEVVRFASFACSGAEVYDGILTGQKNPPGAAYSWDGVTSYGVPGVPASSQDRYLRHSQVQALSKLVCRKAADTENVSYGHAPEPGIRKEQRAYFGKLAEPYCVVPQHAVDDLLLMIGGNDAGFSGVVTWVILPQDLDWRLLAPFTPILRAAIRNRLDPVDPDAAMRAIGYISDLYAHVRRATTRLGIPASRTQLALYPEVVDQAVARSEAAMRACNHQTAEGFSPFQVFLEESARHGAARFGAREANVRSLVAGFIKPLRDAQRAAKGEWGEIDTNDAFKGKGLCNSVACTGDACVTGDRLRWAWSFADRKNQPWSAEACDRGNSRNNSQVSHACEIPPLRYIADFDAYDARRSRGLRYATDAFMAAAARDATGKRFRLDGGISGSAHPTANIHGLIADRVRLSPKK